MMTKFNVGDNVRVIGDLHTKRLGKEGVITGDDGTTVAPYRVVFENGEECWKYGKYLELVIPATPPAPKKSARITALESQVATLQAKVEALEKAGKYPLTERFERESTSMDGILADIERKAKPTLEALLATYPAVKSANEQRADVIKRAKAFVAKYPQGKAIRDKSLPIVRKAGTVIIELHVNAEKRVVTAIVKWANIGGVRDKVFAKCDPDDVFNADIGKAIALARALGVDVPVEFVKAVQPTEVVVGHKITWSYRNYIYEVKTGMRIVGVWNGRDYTPFAKLSGSTILDDTDAVYE